MGHKKRAGWFVVASRAGFVSLDEADLLRRGALPGLGPNIPPGGAQAREFNLHPPAILMQGQNPFVISTCTSMNLHHITPRLEILPVYLGRSALDIVGIVEHSRPLGN